MGKRTPNGVKNLHCISRIIRKIRAFHEAIEP
jgi:hypothetical protein